ncbi:MAG: hypothetical protein Q7R95_01945 [bacterium]|nr:hypothetical protein [bacterium]
MNNTNEKESLGLGIEKILEIIPKSRKKPNITKLLLEQLKGKARVLHAKESEILSCGEDVECLEKLVNKYQLATKYKDRE